MLNPTPALVSPTNSYSCLQSCMKRDNQAQLFALLSQKINLLEAKEETVNQLSFELMAATEREAHLNTRLQELLKRQEKYKVIQGELEQGGSIFEQMLQKLIDREEKLEILTKKYNAMEKSLQVQKMKVKALMAKSENNIYQMERLDESDEKLMEKRAKEESHTK